MFPSGPTRFARNVYGLLEKTRSRTLGGMSPDAKITAALDACAAELAERGCPRSVSLFQFALGAMLQRGVISPKFRDDYFVLVTSELETFFPAVSGIRPESRFDLESATHS